jgi:CRP-like cAMP-binding protein
VFQQLKQHINSTIAVSDDEFDIISSFFHPLELKKKEHLYRQNDVCKYIGFVQKGCLRNYYVDEKGDEQILYFALEDWWVADLQSFFLRIPTMFNLQALESCQLLVSTKTEFEEAFAAVPKFEKFYRIKTQKAYTSTQKSVVEKVETAESRYQKILETFPSILNRVPQHYLASYLGIKPQSLSRIRKKLTARK